MTRHACMLLKIIRRLPGLYTTSISGDFGEESIYVSVWTCDKLHLLCNDFEKNECDSISSDSGIFGNPKKYSRRIQLSRKKQLCATLQCRKQGIGPGDKATVYATLGIGPGIRL